MSNVLPEYPDSTCVAEPAGQPGTAPAPPDVDRGDLRSRQEAVVAMGRWAIAPPDLSILMQDAASLIAEMLGAEHSCTAELAPDGSKIIHTLVLREPGSATPRICVHESGTVGGNSLAAYTLEVAHPVVVAELAQETRFCDRFLQGHRIRSAIGVPLQLQDRSFGALEACTSQLHQFDTEDVLFAETVAHLITTTIARVRAENTLAEERRLSDKVLQTVGAMVLVLDAQGRILRVNHACENITGFSSDEIQGRPIWDVFLVPEEAGVHQAALGKLREGVSPIEFESLLLTKHSDGRRIVWSYAALPGADGSIESIIATGVDITAQRQAEERAAQAELSAQKSRSTTDGKSTASSDKTEDRAVSARGKSPAPTKEELAALVGLPGPINSERRRRPRRSYPYRQLVAPILGPTLPDEDEFTEIECNDISAGGFSFLSPRPPQSEMLVVALGSPPRLTHLMAQVVHVTRVERKGRRMYLVGCSYTGRAEY